MNATDPKDFEKAVARHKQNLAEVRALLDEQTAMLEELTREFDKLGIDTSKLPSLESLPKEYQEQYLQFSRGLKEIDDILKPGKAKAKPAVRRQRSMI